ncbi:hypothetical protein QOT17_013270 [Balamuthia mandrillaris]
MASRLCLILLLCLYSSLATVWASPDELLYSVEAALAAHKVANNQKFQTQVVFLNALASVISAQFCNGTVDIYTDEQLNRIVQFGLPLLLEDVQQCQRETESSFAVATGSPQEAWDTLLQHELLSSRKRWTHWGVGVSPGHSSIVDDMCWAVVAVVSRASHLSPEGSPCGQVPGTICAPIEVCDGKGRCIPATGNAPVGTPCGNPFADYCTAPDTCDGLGNCRANHAPLETVCADESSSIDDECGAQGFCDGGGNCRGIAWVAHGTPCGVSVNVPHNCTYPNDTALCVNVCEGFVCNGAGNCTYQQLNPGDDCECIVASDHHNGTCQADNSCLCEGCFPPFATVLLEEGRRIRMDQLQEGHRVQVLLEDGSLGFEPVVAMLHTSRAALTAYRTFHLQPSAGQKAHFTLSPGHNVYVLVRQQEEEGSKFFSAEEVVEARANGRIVATFAENVNAGDYLLWNNPESGNQLMAVRVEKVEESRQAGLYDPMTPSGTILVDNVLASVYSEFSPEIAHWVFAPLRWMTTLFPPVIADQHEAEVTMGGEEVNMHWYPQLFKTIFVDSGLSKYLVAEGQVASAFSRS